MDTAKNRFPYNFVYVPSNQYPKNFKQLQQLVALRPTTPGIERNLAFHLLLSQQQESKTEIAKIT